jgi:hypothetical protein
MKHDQNRWENLRRDGGNLLPSDFASRVMKAARIKQRRSHTARIAAGAITVFLLGAASTRWIVNSVIDQNQGAVQKLALQDLAGKAAERHGVVLADDDPLLDSVSRILFPIATADLGTTTSAASDLDDRNDSDAQDDAWVQDSTCGGDAKCLAYNAANPRSDSDQEVIW